MSTFDVHRPIFDSLEPADGVENHANDLIDFLAVVQRLQVAILQANWQPRRPILGAGGQGRIDQASVTTQAGLAFKRVSEAHYGTMTNDGMLLIKEIAVLHHPLVRVHPNIVQLQGVGWDIRYEQCTNSDTDSDAFSPQYTVWPTLIFERSIYGDLHNFVTNSHGQRLSVKERLKLCVDVCTAIRDMHSQRIIHGDIKPQNVIVFKTGDGFTARVTDFGYSTCWSSENDRILLPRSRPWQAPEHTFSPVTPVQARQMDTFSVCLLCLWLLFPTSFPQTVSHNQEKQHSAPTPVHEYVAVTWDDIEDMKQTGRLVGFAEHLLEADKDISAEDKDVLSHLFRNSLATNPSLRTNLLDGCQLLRSNTPHIVHGLWRQSPGENDFQLSESITQFYHSDFRVRIHIKQCLDRRLWQKPIGPMALQLALCYLIGFGCARDETKAQDILITNNATIETLDGAFAQIRGPQNVKTAGDVFRTMDDAGYLTDPDFYETYRQQGQVQIATTVIRQECKNVEDIFGSDNMNVIRLKRTLAMLLNGERKYVEAEALSTQVLAARTRVRGETDITTTKAMGDLANICANQRQFKDAERLQLRRLEILETLATTANMQTNLTMCMHDLAALYNAQGFWEKGEALALRVLELNRETFGEEHFFTLAAMTDLASTYEDQGRWKEAEALETHAHTILNQFLGPEHDLTLSSMQNLATIRAAQGRWVEAETMQQQIIETRKRTMKHTDNVALACARGQLASIYRRMGRYDAAEELQVAVLDDLKRLLDAEHLETLNNTIELALIYNGQGKFEEAAQIMRQVVDVQRRRSGEEHDATLGSMNVLSISLVGEGNWEEAEVILPRLLECNKRLKGDKHAITLTTVYNLARTYHRTGKWKEAEELLAPIVNSMGDLQGSEYPKVLDIMGILASIYTDDLQYGQAENLLLRTIDARVARQGSDHADTLESMSELSTLYSKQGRLEEAERLQLQVLERQEKTLLKDHPSVFATLNNLAVTYSYAEKWQEAEAIQTRLLEADKRLRGDEDPATICSMCNLAAAYDGQERWIEAQELYEQALKISERVLGPEHPYTLYAMSNLASTLECRGLLQEAINLMVRVSRAWREKLGPDHQRTIDHEETLQEWRSRLDAEKEEGSVES